MAKQGDGVWSYQTARAKRWAFALRIETSTGRRLLKRGGFLLAKDAQGAKQDVEDLVRLVKKPTDPRRAKLGDLIFACRVRDGRLDLPDYKETERRIGARVDLSAPSMSTGDYLDRWLDGRRRIEETTRQGHAGCIQRDLRPHLGDVPLDELTADHIDAMLTAILDRGVSPASLHQVFGVLRAALNKAVKDRLIPFNPCAQVELPYVTPKEAAFLEPEEVVRLLAAVEGDRDAVTFRVALLGGMRPGEVCGLRWEDVDWRANRLHVRMQFVHLNGEWVLKGLKGKRSRYVDLDAGTMAELRRHRAQQNEERLRLSALGVYQDGNFVFTHEDGTPTNRKSLSYRFKVVAQQVGVRAEVRGLHAARHTSATLDLIAGIDVQVTQKRLGHARTSITQDVYRHVIERLQDQAAEGRAALLSHPIETRGASS
jgi:integrase